jgi:hypothetical protein
VGLAANWLQGVARTMATRPGRQEATMTSTPAIGRFRQTIENATIPACDVWGTVAAGLLAEMAAAGA